MTSHRLPNKIFKKINGQYLIDHVIDNCGPIDEQIIVAIPESTSNDFLADYLLKIKIPCYRGDENDLLSRYYHCAALFGLDIIIRVCADTPFIKWQDIMNNVFQFYHEDQKRMIYGNGSWVFNYEMLQQAYIRETEGREHVCRSMTNSIDYESDLRRVECLV